jgi:uncharacterized membrane protein YdjX (TVP38/TMEM64 family)
VWCGGGGEVGVMRALFVCILLTLCPFDFLSERVMGLMGLFSSLKTISTKGCQITSTLCYFLGMRLLTSSFISKVGGQKPTTQRIHNFILL